MKSRTPILLFAALGLGSSLTSSYVHYKALTDRSFSSFCDVNATVSCTQAYLSSYGSFLGVPVALAGVFFFALVIAIAALSGRRTPRAAESAPAYIFALSTITTVLAPEANGGALQGGEDAITDVSLVGGTTAAAGEAVVFRLQQTQLDTSKASRGDRIQYAALTVTATAKVESN